MPLEENAAKAAAKASCDRCGRTIMETESAIGVVTGYYRAVALGTVSPFSMCGECGLELREFITPQLKEDPVYLGLKRTVQGMWSR